METCSCEKTVLKTDIGILQIFCCENGVHSINILPADNLDCEGGKSFEILISNGSKDGDAMKYTIFWLKSYFRSSMKGIEKPPPVCPKLFINKGNFTTKVWKTLMTEVSFGETISYSHLATLSGNAAASRAVGTAMKNNCIPLIIPCHRVVKSDGKIGQFSCGKDIKKWLLLHEKAFF